MWSSGLREEAIAQTGLKWEFPAFFNLQFYVPLYFLKNIFHCVCVFYRKGEE